MKSPPSLTGGGSSSLSSRSSFTHKNNIPALHVTSSVTDQDEDMVEILEGKVRILEQVVKQQQQNDSTSSDAAAKAIKEINTKLINANKTVQEFESKIKELEKQLDQAKESKFDQALENTLRETKLKLEQKVQSLSTDLDKQGQENKIMKESIQSKETNYATELAKVKQKMQRAKEQDAALLKRVQDELHEERKLAIKGKDDEIKALKVDLKSREDIIQKLKAELEEIPKKLNKETEERIEIAKAAVSAAEKREQASLDQVEELKTQLKQAKVQVKVQLLTIQHFEREQDEYEEELVQLEKALAIAETELEDKIMELEQHKIDESLRAADNKKKSRSLWSRIKN